ncbi:Chromatin remodeling protein EBS [Camellia lanceoleosa]|uniref:Chromatin remodeling protein EBS n=1 Tax=Camellia lanceoleosa TaxID=1840588 RepID=A0ACC0FKR9_9ERIC|nr:Chromatin remodeling protein EBS [Camellia lanceoleosa]
MERKSCSCRTTMMLSAHTIEGKCLVHSFKNYTKLENVGTEDYYCRFEYKVRSAFTLTVLLQYCKCEMPYNPYDLMVQCEGARIACVNMTIEQAKMLDHFMCSDCSSDNDIKKPQNTYPSSPLTNGKAISMFLVFYAISSPIDEELGHNRSILGTVCVPLKLIDSNQGNDQSQVPHHRHCYAPIFGVWQKFLVVLWKVLETSVPPINRIGQTKLMHHQAIHLVKRICREVIDLDNTKASSILRLPFLLAAQYGIHEIVKEILDSFPDAITFRGEENHTAFHLAVIYRHEKVFKVMHQRSGQYKLLLSLSPDNDSNNMLHLVGYKARQQRLDFSSGAVLQMQRELQWF